MGRVATIQPWCCGTKAATDSIKWMGWLCSNKPSFMEAGIWISFNFHIAFFLTPKHIKTQMQGKNILMLSVQLWQLSLNREFFFFFGNSEITLWTVNKSLLYSKEEFEFTSIGKLLPNTLAFWLIPLLKSQEFSLIKGKSKNKHTHTHTPFQVDQLHKNKHRPG